MTGEISRWSVGPTIMVSAGRRKSIPGIGRKCLAGSQRDDYS
jgi:hypothetical protein